MNSRALETGACIFVLVCMVAVISLPNIDCTEYQARCALENKQHNERLAAQRTDKYRVWCKLNNVTNLTYGEWDIAERNRMLPEQKVEDAKDSGQLGAAAAGAVGGWLLRSMF